VDNSDEEVLQPMQESEAPAPEELPLLPNSPCAFDDNSVSCISVNSKILTSLFLFRSPLVPIPSPMP
jgi:hypothetical protein